MTTKRRFLVAGGIVSLLVAIVAVIIMTIPGSFVLGSLGDREVRGHARGPGGSVHFWSDGHEAKVQLGKQSARLTSDTIELEGGRTIKIPADCKKIGLFEQRGGMRVVFDNQEAN